MSLAQRVYLHTVQNDQGFIHSRYLAICQNKWIRAKYLIGNALAGTRFVIANENFPR